MYSTKAHANIKDINYTEALSMPGVKDFICHKDVPGPNLWGPVIHDEEVFASSTVSIYVGPVVERCNIGVWFSFSSVSHSTFWSVHINLAVEVHFCPTVSLKIIK